MNWVPTSTTRSLSGNIPSRLGPPDKQALLPARHLGLGCGPSPLSVRSRHNLGVEMNTWKKRFGMFQADDVRRLKQLEAETGG